MRLVLTWALTLAVLAGLCWAVETAGSILTTERMAAEPAAVGAWAAQEAAARQRGEPWHNSRGELIERSR